MRIIILHPGLKLRVIVTWRDVSAMTGDAILQEIEKKLSSPLRVFGSMIDRWPFKSLLLRLCIYENVLIYASLTVRQTYLISTYSNVLTTP